MSDPTRAAEALAARILVALFDGGCLAPGVDSGPRAKARILATLLAAAPPVAETATVTHTTNRIGAPETYIVAPAPGARCVNCGKLGRDHATMADGTPYCLPAPAEGRARDRPELERIRDGLGRALLKGSANAILRDFEAVLLYAFRLEAALAARGPEGR